MGFEGKERITTLEGVEQAVSQGPTAAIVPIKQLGTNGGGYFGPNSSHPLENPTFLSNMIECWSILIIPMSMVFALGFYLRRKKISLHHLRCYVVCLFGRCRGSSLFRVER